MRFKINGVIHSVHVATNAVEIDINDLCITSLDKDGSQIGVSHLPNDGALRGFMEAHYNRLEPIPSDQKAPLEDEIRSVCNEMAEFLIGKNRAYGNSAAEPVGVFAKRLDSLAQIDVRIDDKLSRIKKGAEYPGDDTIKDLAGYLLLRMVVAKKTNGGLNGTQRPNQ